MNDNSLEDLKIAVKSELEKKGVLNEVRARIMAEILYSMTEENNENMVYNEISEENMILNSIVHEYLTFKGYQNTATIFRKESKMESDTDTKETKVLNSEDLRKLLKIEEKSELPLLYFFLKHLIKT